MLKSSLCDYSDISKLGQRAISVANATFEYTTANYTNKKVIYHLLIA